MLRQQQSNLISTALLVLAGLFVILLSSCTQEEKKAPAPRARPTGKGEVQTQAKQEIDPASVVAVIETAKGNMEFEFFAADAPQTSKNFIKNAKLGYYKDETFKRVEELLIQAESRFVDDTIPIEQSDRTPKRGIVAMAKEEGATVSHAAAFFICKDTLVLDSDYTIFGNLISGLDVLDSIERNDRIMNITIRDK